MNLVTVKDVPICATGVEYSLSSGPATFTEQDLQDAVQAANDDPTLRTPRLKLGHVGASWQDAEPAFGQFSDLRISANGQELVADIVNCPDWLAEILPAAYPSRSIEGSQSVVSNAGKRYGLVIEAVSLLGVVFPGVGSLDDLEAAYTNPEVQYDENEGVFNITAKLPRLQIRAQADTDNVRRAFYEVVAVDDQYWWWLRSVRLEPNEVIAEDDETGKLYRVPFEVKERDVTFGDPVEVYIEYNDVPASEQVAASWLTAARSRPSDRSGGMNPKQLRAAIGLPEDATDDAVRERIKAMGGTVVAETPPAEVTPPEEGEGESSGEEEEAGEATTTEEPEAPAEGTATVDAAAFRQLQQDAAMGRIAREQQIAARQEGIVAQAIKDGKIPPARKDHYMTLMKADEKGTTDLLAKLEANVIPISPKGETTGLDVTSSEAYPDTWLNPAERARKSAFMASQKGA